MDLNRVRETWLRVMYTLSRGFLRVGRLNVRGQR